MISCFKYLGSLLPILGTKDTKWSVPFTGIYDDCCEKMHEFMRNVIVGRNSENHIQSIILMKLGLEFDSPKNIYQTHYYELCTRMLEIKKGKADEKNILKKYQSQRNNSLQDTIFLLLQQASKGFSNC